APVEGARAEAALDEPPPPLRGRVGVVGGPQGSVIVPTRRLARASQGPHPFALACPPAATSTLAPGVSRYWPSTTTLSPGARREATTAWPFWNPPIWSVRRWAVRSGSTT